MVEEFRWPLELAADCGFGRGTALAMTAQVVAASLALLPGCGGVVSCCVRCSRVLLMWWRSLRRLMYKLLLLI
jgi:hypothetical protein